ncbi:MAG: hypothetical protein IT366_10885 [Candidatus Hydrogenedentes bacterium]|nr:hypothetical protein [Candidatus Hydrogenedentota bacterium]
MSRHSTVPIAIATFALFLATTTHAQDAPTPLRWCAYLTNGSVQKLASDPAALEKAPERLKALGISKVYLEFFRQTPVSNDDLKKVSDALGQQGFETAAGIATLPGENYGVREDAKLGWFNWQAQKTRDDVATVMSTAAPLFSEIIVDDFFCTGDMSAESVAAKGELPWGDYRRALMVQAAQQSVIVPAKTANPTATLIMKFPQWYDRFHEFGYDVPAESAMFDRIWVGTETRGPGTVRFGFTQPYQGFVNLRWISSIAGPKTAGAWFDHGDCDANDFIDQAYQSVLAGAREIMIFAYSDIEEGHPGHELLKQEQDNLAKLSAVVQENPVLGVYGYKPANTDAGPDLFIMDYIGMLGVPLVPTAFPPAGARVVFLPTQAAGDPAIATFIRNAIAQKVTLVMTTGFLATAPMRDDLVRYAGVRGPIKLDPLRAMSMRIKGADHAFVHGLDLAANLALDSAKPLLMADVGGKKVPFFTVNETDGAKVYVLNTRTFSQADYDAVGEVLLPPRQLGLMELPEAAVNTIREAFTLPLGYKMEAPVRVTLQPLGPSQFVIQNYTSANCAVRLSASFAAKGKIRDQFSGRTYTPQGRQIDIPIPSRSRVWLAAQ